MFTDELNKLAKNLCYNTHLKFLGVYACNEEMIKNHKERYSFIIFNTDPVSAPGKHWTCALIDNKYQKIYYFDSYGIPPNKCIQVFINKMYTGWLIINNNIRHQYNNDFCGYYVLFFLQYIINRLKIKKTVQYPEKIKDVYIKKFIKSI